MQIKLDDEYKIVDGNGISYDLVQVGSKKNKKGKYPERAISYHGTVAQALQSYVRLKASQEIKGDLTLSEYLKEYNDIVDRVAKIAEVKTIG